jgi:hypothetical protein
MIQILSLTLHSNEFLGRIPTDINYLIILGCVAFLDFDKHPGVEIVITLGDMEVLEILGPRS